MNGYSDLITKTARAIVDDRFIQHWNNVDYFSFGEARVMMIHEDFRTSLISKYRRWIASATSSPVFGLDKFSKVVLPNAVTHSLDCFVVKCIAQEMRIRTFRGEYPYVSRLLKFHGQPDIRIEDEPLRLGDAVVVSYPFSATGDKHHAMFEMLNRCNELDIPVMVDCAFWPACYEVPLILEHECIKHVAFSFSKGFPVAGVRFGIEFMREGVTHPLDVFSLDHYFNRFGAYAIYRLMSTFDPDYLTNKYRKAQIEVCNALDLVPSKTLIFGLSNNERWDEYSREGVVNRPCITKAIEKAMGFR